MAEVTLKKKITLRRKEEQAAFTFSGKLKVKLLWQSDTDLDLCLFFTKKNGEVGGVFSNAMQLTGINLWLILFQNQISAKR